MDVIHRTSVSGLELLCLELPLIEEAVLWDWSNDECIAGLDEA